MNILVADDDNTSRLLLKRILTKQDNWNVVEFVNGSLAWNYLDQGHQVDLCLLDMRMPIMDGIAVLRAMRKDVRYVHTPVFIVSSLADRSIIAQASSMGLSGYFVKPFQAEALVETIKKVMKNQAAVQDDPRLIMNRLQFEPEDFVQQLAQLIADVQLAKKEIREILLKGNPQAVILKLDGIRGACILLGANQFAQMLTSMMEVCDQKFLISNLSVLDQGLQTLEQMKKRVENAATEKTEKEKFKLDEKLLGDPFFAMKSSGLEPKAFIQKLNDGIVVARQSIKDAEEALSRHHMMSAKMRLDTLGDLCKSMGAEGMAKLVEESLTLPEDKLLPQIKKIQGLMDRLAEEIAQLSAQVG